LLLDGVFLLRPQLRDCFELSIRLEVSEDTALARALTRDVPRLGDRATVRERYERRYGPSQRLYVERVRPGDTADIVIDNEDPTNPRLKRWPTAGRDTQAMDLQSEPSDLHLTGGTRRNRG
jgi:uridine kinase